MISVRVILLAGVVLTAACELSPQIPSRTRQEYPVLIRDSAERRAKAEREWKRLLDVYKIPQTSADFYPVILTPRSLAGVRDGIKLIAGTAGPSTDQTAVREAVRTFIDRWRDLLGGDPVTLSLVSSAPSKDGLRLTYRQTGFPFSIAGNYGEMVVVLTSDGRLVQLDDRLVPQIDAPTKPEVDRNSIATRLAGRTLTVSDTTGASRQFAIGPSEEIQVKQLVLLPLEADGMLKVHLAWEVVSAKTPDWLIYIDAINAAQLLAVQNSPT